MTIYHKDFRFSSNFKHHFFSGKKWWLVSRQPFPAPPRSRQTGHPPTGDVSLREKFSTKGAAHVFFCLNKKVPPNDLPHVPHNNVFELRGLEKNSLLGQWLNGIFSGITYLVGKFHAVQTTLFQGAEMVK